MMLNYQRIFLVLFLASVSEAMMSAAMAMQAADVAPTMRSDRGLRLCTRLVRRVDAALERPQGVQLHAMSVEAVPG